MQPALLPARWVHVLPPLPPPRPPIVAGAAAITICTNSTLGSKQPQNFRWESEQNASTYFHTGCATRPSHSSDMIETTSSTPPCTKQVQTSRPWLAAPDRPDGGHHAGNTSARPSISQWRLRARPPEPTSCSSHTRVQSQTAAPQHGTQALLMFTAMGLTG
ncbi:hypothetical protein M441DRAFT_296868 [Trichoderma asperellum CBS 433.97]|uniref:Uncharacterized protein n=1 Tax=Trichoderma asperellum (strain ATCC 204424 / CBS 433.97 / NBRC 101777) TaxID=1042311 RepID=A0A2T3YST0_TRIA4|nr:hypothetical protein M441DRAFT_296868 [Trichoderma asperellum CBS 433.97]PTB35628.1 hypothetical protein M441DRAFT_296868 [Trichoderma asperellum CBS 433.97]